MPNVFLHALLALPISPHLNWTLEKKAVFLDMICNIHEFQLGRSQQNGAILFTTLIGSITEIAVHIYITVTCTLLHNHSWMHSRFCSLLVTQGSTGQHFPISYEQIELGSFSAEKHNICKCTSHGFYLPWLFFSACSYTNLLCVLLTDTGESRRGYQSAILKDAAHRNRPKAILE